MLRSSTSMIVKFCSKFSFMFFCRFLHCIVTSGALFDYWRVPTRLFRVILSFDRLRGWVTISLFWKPCRKLTQLKLDHRGESWKRTTCFYSISTARFYKQTGTSGSFHFLKYVLDIVVSVIQGALYLNIYSSCDQTCGYSIRSFNKKILKKVERSNPRIRSL